MLIICPDCGSKISQYAETCMSCGFPLSKMLEKNKITDLSKNLICPKCGYYVCGNSEEMHIKCEYCNTFFIQTDKTPAEFEHEIYEEWMKDDRDYDTFAADFSKKYCKDQFDQEAFERRKAEAKQWREQWYKQKEAEKVASTSNTKANIPKCPTCNSTNIQKISTTKRVGSIIGFGILSKNIGKTYECKNCGYKW